MTSMAILLAVIRVGIIGCDTSHTVAFAKIMNTEKPDFAQDFQVVAAHKWGSKDIFSSTNRFEKYIKELTEERGVKMYDTIEELLENVDCVCLETCDGRPHPEQAEKVFKAGKRVFIDKPIGENYASAKKIYDLGLKYGAKYFSSSALRYAEAQQTVASGKYGKIMGAYYFAPSPVEAQGTHNRYSWYGIHGFEPIITVMGVGVESVRTVSNGEVDEVLLKWKDGRLASLRLSQRNGKYGGYAFPEKGSPQLLAGYEGYKNLLKRICQFFKDGVVPVSNEETLEIFAAMEAAEISYKENGREVKLTEVR